MINNLILREYYSELEPFQSLQIVFLSRMCTKLPHSCKFRIQYLEGFFG